MTMGFGRFELFFIFGYNRSGDNLLHFFFGKWFAFNLQKAKHIIDSWGSINDNAPFIKLYPNWTFSMQTGGMTICLRYKNLAFAGHGGGGHCVHSVTMIHWCYFICQVLLL